MSDKPVPSTIGATYVDPSAEEILEPGVKIGDLYPRNMSNPYVLQRLGERSYWVQSFNYGTVFYVGDDGVLIFDTLEGGLRQHRPISGVGDRQAHHRCDLSALPRRPHRRYRALCRGCRGRRS